MSNLHLNMVTGAKFALACHLKQCSIMVFLRELKAYPDGSHKL